MEKKLHINAALAASVSGSCPDTIKLYQFRFRRVKCIISHLLSSKNQFQHLLTDSKDVPWHKWQRLRKTKKHVDANKSAERALQFKVKQQKRLG
jgi:hypothetical protein